MAERAFKCPDCNFSTLKKYNLNRHIERKHSIEREVCAYCLKTFRDITKHTEYFHPTILTAKSLDVSELNCPHCSQRFPISGDRQFFRDHVAVCAQNPLTWRNSCNICHKKFPSKSALNTHKKRKHQDLKLSGKGELEVDNDSQPLDSEIEKARRGLNNGTLDFRKLIQIINKEESRNENFQTKKVRNSFTFTPLSKALIRMGYMIDIVRTALVGLVEIERKQNTLAIQVVLDSPKYLDYPIATPLQLAARFSIDFVLDSIEKVLQSKTELGMDAPMILDLKVVEDEQAIVAKGLRPLQAKKFATLESFMKKSYGVVDVSKIQQNYPDLKEACFFLCVCLALSVPGSELWKITRRHSVKEHKLSETDLETLKKLYTLCGIVYGEAVKMEHLQTIHDILWSVYDRQLVVYRLLSSNIGDCELLFRGKEEEKNKITIICWGEHSYLVSVPKFLSKIAKLCECGYLKIEGVKHHHNPTKKCSICGSETCYYSNDRDKPININYFCSNCRCYFRSSICYQEHLTHVCQKYIRCEKCFRKVKRENYIPPEKHRCGKIKCKGCFEIVDPNNHFCQIQPDKKEEKQHKRQIFIFADFECYKEENSLQHKVNLAVAHVTCEKCINDFDETKEFLCCRKPEEGREKVFSGENTLENFCTWLFYTESLKKAVVFFHYGGRYDCILILGELLRRRHSPDVICKGTRILTLTAGFNVTVKDSYSLVALPLEKFPKAFDLEISNKLFFPLALSDRANPFEIGIIPFPEKSAFYPEHMNKERKEAFLKWYEENTHLSESFNFEKEYIEYCRIDVKILHQAMAKLRSNMMEITGVCPLTTSYTLPQYVGKVFRNVFLNSEFQIGLFSEANTKLSYLKRKQSAEAIKFFNYLNSRNNYIIKHAGNSFQEYKIGPYFVDGIEEETKTVYEYHGCFVHGHYDCQKERFRSKHPLYPGLNFADVYAKSLNRIREIESLDYTVRVFWSCEVEQHSQLNPELKQFMENSHSVRYMSQPIQNCREALYGGRTNNIALLCTLSQGDINEGWKIKFVDINSLYPFSMRYKPYPCGNPRILTGSEIPFPFGLSEAKKFNGILKCTVLPPDFLYFPVLPFRNPETGLISFPLCRTCALEKDHKKTCIHEDVESRGWTATYCTPEIVAALERDYIITEVFELWDFPEMKFIFEDYMKEFCAIKYANSGFPSDVRTPEEKSEFVRELNEIEGLHLELENITANECLKNLSKLMMNSLFGKFAQNAAKSSDEIKYVSSGEKLRKLIRDPATDIVNLELFDEVMMVQTKKKEGELRVHKLSNPIISAFITSYSRIHLLESIEKLDIRVLYFDTDSIIWLAKDSDGIFPEMSPFFGDFKNELEEDDFITDFVAIAPKTYAFRTKKGRNTVKAKGLCLKQKYVDEHFDFDAMRAVLLNKVKDLDNFYEQFPDSYRKRKMLEIGENYKRAKRKRKGVADQIPGADTALVLPDPKLVRTRGGVIREDNDRCKIVRVNFNKRQLWVPTNGQIKFCSLPWGTLFPPGVE